jgi:hypothetical protein
MGWDILRWCGGRRRLSSQSEPPHRGGFGFFEASVYESGSQRAQTVGEIIRYGSACPAADLNLVSSRLIEDTKLDILGPPWHSLAGWVSFATVCHM